MPTRFANLDLVPSRPDLAGAAVELAQRDDGERFLAQALRGRTARYPFVFLDCPPSLGPLTVNALAAADRVLVPVQAEYYALEGLAQLLDSVELVRAAAQSAAAVAGVLLTMVDRPHAARGGCGGRASAGTSAASCSARPSLAPCGSPRRRATGCR